MIVILIQLRSLRTRIMVVDQVLSMLLRSSWVFNRLKKQSKWHMVKWGLSKEIGYIQVIETVWITWTEVWRKIGSLMINRALLLIHIMDLLTRQLKAKTLDLMEPKLALPKSVLINKQQVQENMITQIMDKLWLKYQQSTQNDQDQY